MSDNIQKIKGKARRAFEFAGKAAVILTAGAVGTKLMGDPQTAMQYTNSLLNRDKGPQ